MCLFIIILYNHKVTALLYRGGREALESILAAKHNILRVFISECIVSFWGERI